MFSLKQMVTISLTRILTRSLSLHPSRSYPFITTTLCSGLNLLLQRSCLTPCLHISPLDLATHSTFIGSQNTPTININIHVARKANKASIAKILGKLYSENTRLHSLFIVTEVLVIMLHISLSQDVCLPRHIIRQKQ